jgi:hypothetical protein
MKRINQPPSLVDSQWGETDLKARLGNILILIVWVSQLHVASDGFGIIPHCISLLIGSFGLIVLVDNFLFKSFY